MQPMNWNLVIEKLLSCTNIRYVKANIFRNYNLSSIEIELLALCMFCKWTNMYPCRHSSTHRCVLADTAPFIDVFLQTQLHSSMCSSTHYVYRFHEDATISLLLQQNPTLHLPDHTNHTESTMIINSGEFITIVILWFPVSLLGERTSPFHEMLLALPQLYPLVVLWQTGSVNSKCNNPRDQGVKGCHRGSGFSHLTS